MTDAVALASILTSATVGIGGLAFAAWNAKSEREHQRKLGREERIHDRRAEVYVSMLANLEREVFSAERIYPIAGPLPEPPKPLSDEDWMTLKAKVAAFGSAEIIALVTDFNKMMITFAQGWQACKVLEDAGLRANADFAKNFKKLDDARTALREELLPKIEEAVRSELTST